jgi:plastocyanin
VWQPEQRSEKSWAPCCTFYGGEEISEEIPSEPHATAPAATTTRVAAMAGRRRPMSGAIIRKVMTGGRVTLLLVALAALPVGGCGTDVAYTRAPDRRVEVRLDEYRVLPEHIEVRAGRVTLVAHNDGRLTHNLAVVQFERPLGTEQEKGYGDPTKTLFPGETGQTTVDLKPGKYRLVCTIANHDNLGQYGELKVVR